MILERRLHECSMCDTDKEEEAFGRAVQIMTKSHGLESHTVSLRYNGACSPWKRFWKGVPNTTPLGKARS